MSELITVCAWCHPGESIYILHPEWKGLGLKISHGICQVHQNEMAKEIERFHLVNAEIEKVSS